MEHGEQRRGGTTSGSGRPSASDAGMQVFTAMLVIVVGAVLLLLTQLAGDAISTYARHLCGWPATISCPGDQMVGFWRVVLVALYVVAAGAAVEGHRALRRNGGSASHVRLVGYACWGLAVCVVGYGLALDRTVAAPDLVVGGALASVAAALALGSVDAASGGLRPRQRIAVVAIVLALLVGRVLTMPASFVAAADRDAAARRTGACPALADGGAVECSAVQPREPRPSPS